MQPPISKQTAEYNLIKYPARPKPLVRRGLEEMNRSLPGSLTIKLLERIMSRLAANCHDAQGRVPYPVLVQKSF